MLAHCSGLSCGTRLAPTGERQRQTPPGGAIREARCILPVLRLLWLDGRSNMRLTIISKNNLTEGQRQHLDQRLTAFEHLNDNGPIRCWNVYQEYLYAFINREINLPIAIAEASGRPISTPGWWIDSEFRGQGFGNELVDLLAGQLKAEGVIGIGPIPIDSYLGVYDDQSIKLVKRLRGHFGK